MGILDAEDLFLAAGAVLTGGRLKDTDGDGLFAVGRAGLFAAGNHGKNHDQAKQDCEQFFHFVFLLME